MRYTVIDCETDGLLPTVSKIHVLSYQIFENTTLLSSGSITDPEQMLQFLNAQDLLVGHNIILYDIPVFEKLLGKVFTSAYDTLAISYYLYPSSDFSHGLGAWGERLGFGKPVVEDWTSQPIEVYINRCESDVEINKRVFHHFVKFCRQLYDNDMEAIQRVFRYLTFKFYCLKDQQEEKIKIDLPLVQKSILDLEFAIEEMADALAENMPKTVLKNAPKKMYLQNGEYSKKGLAWLQELENRGLPSDTMVIYQKGNPGSPSQLKSWLYSLGWKPITFETNAKGKEVEKVSLPFGGGLCPSVLALVKNYPYLENLKLLYKARHRLSIFKGFLSSINDNNEVISTAHGFTNTLRLTHSKPIVNLPKVGKYYGEQIRACIVVPDDEYEMCGSDISGLEDTTKQHYIYFFDPKYVEDMRVPGFDPHIDIAILAEMLTKEQESFYKDVEKQKKAVKDFKLAENEEKLYKFIVGERSTAKSGNFSATYGAGPQKISTILDCSLEKAKAFHTTYWERNKAVKQTANACKVKIVNNRKWLYNPVSGLWLYLKAEKDRFSTLNQSTGVYVFDSWVAKVRKKLSAIGVKICLQYHDEILIIFKKSLKEHVRQALSEAMEEMNKEIKLNVPIDFSMDFGKNYAECH